MKDDMRSSQRRNNMHLVHTNREGLKTDITLVGKYLTFSKIVDSKLATINKLIPEDMPVSRFVKIINNVTQFNDETFLMASSELEPKEFSL